MKENLPFLYGAVAACYAIAAMFFLRFWMRARDGLFLCFTAAFTLLAINQALVGIFNDPAENRPLFYAFRLVGFILIISGILWKNVHRR